jgi:hypothetical protein
MFSFTVNGTREWPERLPGRNRPVDDCGSSACLLSQRHGDKSGLTSAMQAKWASITSADLTLPEAIIPGQFYRALVHSSFHRVLLIERQRGFVGNAIELFDAIKQKVDSTEVFGEIG